LIGFQPGGNGLKTQTKYFGEIDYSEEDVLTFPKGMFGFEEERAFLLLPFSGDGTLFSLQSLKTPELSFVAVDPFSLTPGYAPVLQPEELKALGVEKSEELFYYTLCAVKNPVADSTVNLRCPIAINDESRQAMQVILEDKRYGMRHVLSDMEKREDASC